MSTFHFKFCPTIKPNVITKTKNIVFVGSLTTLAFAGNMKADVAAKGCLRGDTFNMKVLFTDLKPMIRKYILLE